MVSVEELPKGVTATVGSMVTTGAATTLTLTRRADASADLVSAGLRIRGKDVSLPDATASLFVTVTVPPDFALTLSRPSLTIVSGGVAPLGVKIVRTNFSQPIAFSIVGAPGISVTSPASVTGDSAELMVAVAASVTPGTYSVSVRGTGTGAGDRNAPLTVVVSPDRLQLISGPALSATQASSVTMPILVNRNAYADLVTLLAEGLPAGITASFQPSAPSGTSTVMTLAVGPAVIPGNYPIVIRGTGAGIPDVTTSFTLTVTAATVAISLNPSTVSPLQGTTSTSTVTITRTRFTGPVHLTAEGAPAGLLVVPQPAVTSGGSASLAITASNAVPTGQYDISIRARPEGLSASAIQTASLTVVVRAAPVGVGNVLLDWSMCTSPDWVAYRDGTGAWTQVIPLAGVVRFNVASTRGAFAWVHKDKSVTTRFMTQAELVARPIDMCVLEPRTKAITGTAEHSNASEQFTYQLGWGSGLSTGANPRFVISGVRDGKHDLTGWAS